MQDSVAQGNRSIALFSPDTIRDRYPVYAEGLRHQGLVTIEGRPGLWAAFRYADCVTLLRDPRLAARPAEFVLTTFEPEQQAQLSDLVRLLNQWVLFMNEPQHPPLRKLLNKGFTPSTIESWRLEIENVVERLLTPLRRGSTIELMAEVAYPLPVHVITAMLGLPPDINQRLLQWSDSIAVCLGNPLRTFEQALEAQRAMISLTEYFRDIVAERRRRPESDFISVLIGITEDGAVLTEEQLWAQCVALLFAGHETTRNLIGNGLLTLLTHPNQLAEVRVEGELSRLALEELLRYESPVQTTGRLVTEDLTHANVTMSKGEAIVFVLGAANRDPVRFEDPSSLNLHRPHNLHLSFGHGAHFCIGNQLARMEAQIALSRLLTQFPHMKLIDAVPQWSPNLAFRSLRTLHLNL
jgi:cytochrome P450